MLSVVRCVKSMHKILRSYSRKLLLCVNHAPAGIYLLKVNNRNTRTRCEICSKLTLMTPERHQWRRSGVFIVNFEHISHLAVMFLLKTLNMFLTAGVRVH